MYGPSNLNLLHDTLSEYHAHSLAKIMKLIPDREPRKYLYDLVKDYPQRGGKGFRPALCIATCKAFGGTLERALNSAAALEILHNGFLVHDDIVDGSLYRRGLPTMHEANGLDVAINVGDAMNILGIRPLMENLEELGPTLAWNVFSEVEHMVRQTVEGQAMELGWRKENAVNLLEEDYLSLILKKTCWYTCIHPIRIGALIGTGQTHNIDRFNHFGYYMGAAFQIQDDVLNLIGDESKYGKEIGGDLLEGKRTLMLIHLFNHCSEKELLEIQDYLSTERTFYDKTAIEWMMHLMSKYGSIEYAVSCAKSLANAALIEYHKLFDEVPLSNDKRFLENLVIYMIERDY